MPLDAVGAVIVLTGDAATQDLLWAPLCGRPLCAWAVDACAATEALAEIVIVAPEARLAAVDELARVSGWRRARTVVAPSERRREAVRAGVEALSATSAWALLHDGARPLVTPEILAAGIAVVRGADGLLAAVATEPVKETLKRAQGDRVIETLPRERLVRAQTPFIFPREWLLAALSAPTSASGVASDAAMELTLAREAGLPLVAFPGSHENMLAASVEDLSVIEAALRVRLERVAGATGQ